MVKLILALGLIALTFSIFNVKTLEIKSQAECAPPSLVEPIFRKLLNKNILFINKGGFEKELRKSFFCVKEVKLNKVYPNKVGFEVLPRMPLAIFEKLASDDDLKKTLSLDLKIATNSPTLVDLTNEQKEATISARFLIDTDGYLYSKEINKNLPFIQGFIPDAELGKMIDLQIVRNSLEIVDVLKSLNITPKKLRLRDQKYLKVDCLLESQEKSKDINLFFSLNGDHVRQLASLQLILTKARIDLKSIRVVDLRFDQPVVIYE